MINVDVPVNGDVVLHSRPKENNGDPWPGAVSFSQDVNVVGLFGAADPQDVTLHGQNVSVGSTSIITITGAGQYGPIIDHAQVTIVAPLPAPLDPTALNHFELAVEPPVHQ